MPRRRVIYPLPPVAPEEGVKTREVVLSIGGTEVGRQSVGVEATRIDFGVHDIAEGQEVLFVARDADAAENWSEPPTEVRITPFRDQKAPTAPAAGDPVFEEVPADQAPPETPAPAPETPAPETPAPEAPAPETPSRRSR
jgi:hypothetical protein